MDVGEKAVGSNQIFKGSKHHTVCVFHCLFKALALLCYIFGRSIFDRYILTFIVVTVLVALDFWTVKNVSGRKLAGLRWSSRTAEDGSNSWVFQSVKDETSLNQVDRNVFWMGLYIWPVVWLIIGIANFVSLSFSWLVLVGLAFGFAVSNLIGFWKCSKDAKKSMASWAQGQAMSALTSGVAGNFATAV
eukprot:GEMP01034263.1.p1 GENE.GEMP01034263.1~~GEMP01034263.1.p1  ORF type:complete len:189 (-),score=4.60 GEMP01034263.1:1473-2039(-)